MTGPARLARMPRRQPVQARAAQTVDAICEATMQLLLRHGAAQLTTIRVAERAGVSVGTLYQYFPNKEALLHALVAQHLRRITEVLKKACKRNHGKAPKQMVAGFVQAYVAAQLEHRDAAGMIYRLAMEIGAGSTMAQEGQLVVAEIAAMFRSTADLPAADIDLIAFTFFGAISGATRAALHTSSPASTIDGWERHLERLGQAYLESFALSPALPLMHPGSGPGSGPGGGPTKLRKRG